MNKYSYLSRIPPRTVFNGRTMIEKIYPETKSMFRELDRTGMDCGQCKQNSQTRAILMVILETPKGTRDVAELKRVLPADFVNLL